MNSTTFLRSLLLLVMGLSLCLGLAGCANLTKYSVESYQGPSSLSEPAAAP